MDRDELIENLRTTLLWETVCAHIEHRNEADVLLQKAGMENGVAAECAEIQDSEDFFVTDVCKSGGIVSVSSITYSDVELLGMLGEKNR